MTYKTHVATSTAVALPILILGHILNIFVLVGVLYGAMLPDIDKQGSHVSRTIPILPGILERKFKHRGAVHSLPATGIILLVSIIFFILGLTGIIHTYIPAMLIGGVTLGYLLHLCGDGLSVSGIKWFAPFNKKSYKISDKSFFKFLRYKTIGFSKGKISKEYIYMIVAVIAIIAEVYIFRNAITGQIKYMAMSGMRTIIPYHHRYNYNYY